MGAAAWNHGAMPAERRSSAPPSLPAGSRPAPDADNHLAPGHALRHLLPTASSVSIRAMETAGRTRPFERHAAILRDDEEAAVALVHEGHAGTWRSDPEGRAQLVALVGPGELAGLLSLGPHRRPIRLVALTPGRATTWPAAAILDLARSDAGLAADVLQASLGAAERLLTRVEHVGFDPVARRLARLLWQRRDLLFDARRPLLTRAELADLAGATREMTDRVLRELERDGIVRRVGRGGLVLLDPVGLRERAAPDDDDRECS